LTSPLRRAILARAREDKRNSRWGRQRRKGFWTDYPPLIVRPSGEAASGIERVHAVVGGFHLAPAPDEIVQKAVDAFKAINPDYIIPMHCTGLNTIIAIHREMPKKLVMPSTGTRVVFGA
jgi:hypothetical protein